MKNEIKLVEKAVLGDEKSLTLLIKSVEDLIYNLSIKMLWHPQDAEDASQEILIRVVINLKSFKGDSKFSTWVYRLATNHLITLLNKKKNKNHLNFTNFSKELENGLSDDLYVSKNEGEQILLVEEMKVGCTNGMLQCLDKETRLSYILGDILGFNSTEGSYIQNISSATFRKRISRARTKLFSFMNLNCGIANPKNKCRCKKQINHCVTNKKINPNHLIFAKNDKNLSLRKTIERAENTMLLFNTNPEYNLPRNAVLELRKLLKINYTKQSV